MVDDGSSDGTLNICREMSEKDDRIVVLSGNRGVSRARNTGLQKATGAFIIFLDADDWLDEDIVEKSVAGYLPDKLNMFGCRVHTASGVTVEKLNVTDLSNTELIANDIYIAKRNYNLGEFFRACWGNIFDAELLKDGNCEFPEGLRIGEDAVFLLQYLRIIRGINLISETGNNYNRNISSATNIYMPDCYEQCEMQADLIKQVLKDSHIEITADIRAALINFQWWMFVSLFENNLRGVKQKRIQRIHLNRIFADSEKWVDEHFETLRNKVQDLDAINPRYRMLYDYFHKEQNKYPTAKHLCRWYMSWKLKHKLKLT